jgi:hypothetical protein
MDFAVTNRVEVHHLCSAFAFRDDVMAFNPLA